MDAVTARVVRLQDYRAFPFELPDIDLDITLDAACTRVRSTLSLVRKTPGASEPLILDALALTLESIALDGAPLPPDRFRFDGEKLVIDALPDRCSLTTEVTLNPSANQSDEGLFVLHGKLATQCESEGFRRITFFPDRPDVLSRYRVTLTGDPARYPVMLSNGHPVDSGALQDGRRWVRWEDPYPKPCYIFAIVAGDFGCLSDEYTTGSGRRIALNIYADHDRIGECDFAMGALKRALAWEESRYEREYDLDLYNIVALTGHAGAMENKGLNIFDANGICADPEISTDQDYAVIERILAHEVFHNWTGNRVTCRDWFQLSLKEGLTRFRDQTFSQDMAGGGRRRIEFVRALQRNQFPEDDGPAAHAVRPDHYAEIRNFYTGTVYDKGAEVIRMMYCLLGDSLFREGVKTYLSRFDGQAVRVEDFVDVMQAVGGRDLTQFCRWYHQAGRPRLAAAGAYDAAAQRYTLTLSQRTSPTPGQPDKAPFHVPVLMDLLDQAGQPLPVQTQDATRVDGNWLLELTGDEQDFVFEHVAEAPVPSLLRGFSAPVSLDPGLDADALGLLWVSDPDPFNRWQSGQLLATRQIRSLAARWHAGKPLNIDDNFLKHWRSLLLDDSCEPGLLSELLLLPDEPALSEGLPRFDLDGHRAGRDALLARLVAENRDALLQRYFALRSHGHPGYDRVEPGRRALMNTCLELLLASPDDEVLSLALQQVNDGENMSARFAALAALCHVDSPVRAQALDDFYRHWQHKPSVIDKWFNAQALSRTPDALDAILALEEHPDMDLMNVPRAMAFYGGLFRQNRVAFHDPSGRAYEVLADRLIFIDSVKPGSTYWLMPQLLQWRRMDDSRREKMRRALQRIADADISNALRETVEDALAPDTQES
ncbi:MAG: aminopeptidase N [Halieaceae bacterium]|jgi:aminopeptidase N|nr:aminopeptidase N [Halieaceae bacterium]